MSPELLAFITTIASAVAAIAGVVTTSSVFLLWKRIKASHERSRREKTIELLVFFTRETNYSGSGISPVRAFVESLDRNQCESLQQKKKFVVSANLRNVFSECLLAFDLVPTEHIPQKGGDIEVTTEVVKKIRYRLIHYLNVLETIAAAWRHDVGHQEILEEEFISIISRKKNSFVLEDFRYATGIYPSLEAFVQVLKQRQKEDQKAKPRIA